jgi:hypothetical protein
MFGLMFYALGENMISVEKNTSIEQIDSGWLPEDGKARFFIKADSSFQIFAEAYAGSSRAARRSAQRLAQRRVFAVR